ncbi:MAG: hypothetical protein WCJ56_03010 [bacterium]
MRTIIMGCILLALCAVALAADTDVFEVELHLTNALRAPGADSGTSLVLDLTRTGERWERVWGVESDSRHATLHPGRVREATITDTHVTFDIALEPRNATRVQVDLVRDANDRLTGTYEVTMPTGPNAGKVDGRIKPKRPAQPKEYVPVKPGEHPRILFRASDLPALQEKAKSPLGVALLARMGNEKSFDGIGAGIKWQLTRDQAYADLARKLTEGHMTGDGPGYSARMSKGRHPEQVALAYDLCYDVWPAEFKTKVEAYMVKTVTSYMGKMPGNEHVCSNWNARVHAGAGFCMLALYGEKGPMPTKPAAAAALPFWEDEVNDWKRFGEVNMEYQRLFERTRYIEYLFCREATGTGGFRGECSHYGLLAAEMSIEYDSCYRQMFGMDVSPYNDITWMVPRMMFGQDFPEPGGKTVPLNINGQNGIGGEFFAYAYRLTPEPWKPAHLWAWNRQLGVTGPEGLAKAVAAQGGVDSSGLNSWLFLTYPLDGKPKPPAEIMPFTWEAPDHGYYGFRNGWTGKGDFVLQIHAKAHVTGGWSIPNAGTFRLYGRGQSWNDTYSSRSGIAWEENRVMMPDDAVNQMGQGRVTYTDFQKDGSGAVTINMDDVYGGTTGTLYTMYGNFRNASAFKDLGIKAVRALAVDYSGKSGAPCLFVMVDRIRGGKAKTWTWNLGDAAVVPKVTIADNAFTIPKGTATLRGTFVTPNAVQLQAIVNPIKFAGNGYDAAGMRNIPSILAQGGDDYFMVATVQDAGVAPPAVKVEGVGLDAKVTVGGRRITFDGEKIVIADAP